MPPTLFWKQRIIKEFYFDVILAHACLAAELFHVPKRVALFQLLKSFLELIQEHFFHLFFIHIDGYHVAFYHPFD
ncbi:hypothetical protein A7K69_04675 [Parageobacillus thermoglucosidasius]|uniref:Uncharacterized protein n=1 Tax=Parageobacillus thermoglucosidasius TaxID=1426 RepID=A0A1B7KT79_PARTM|nr:hypothetical protein A7K69_04675 [Parageobacillus thermoglucosidasius]